ncbi:MAG: CPBP family intramembrane metalloprotease [Planctomycetes bacterium]|nr:CPBP family intramembrane metalloprotease [Planctomycetota bacterium]
MLLWKYFGNTDFYADVLADEITFGNPEALAAFYQFSSCLVLLGLVPALIVKLVLRERLADYGLQFGNPLYTIRSFLLAAPLLVIGGYLAAMDPGMREAFPVNKQAGLATPFALHVCTYLLFYLGWEFHFRGFLQFGLSDSMGRTQALLIQVMASSLLHIGRPFTETVAAIGAGILWGWLAYRTNSILSGMMQHILIGVVVDAVIVFS